MGKKSERDFAFVVNKEVDAQDLINAVSSVDTNLVSNVKVFDIYEGDNIPENQKSIAISVTIQSSEKTLNDVDLEYSISLLKLPRTVGKYPENGAVCATI